MAMIEAHITKVEREVDSEWGSIFTDHDTVKKLTTKIAEKLTEAAGLKRSGELAGIEYTEKTRHDPGSGRTYRNFYYERAGSLPSNGARPAEDGIDIVQSAGRSDSPEKRWAIALQGGGKLAVWTLPLMPPEQRDFETQKTIARAWAEFFYFTPPPDAQTSRRPSAYNEPNIEQPPPYVEEQDFPF